MDAVRTTPPPRGPLHVLLALLLSFLILGLGSVLDYTVSTTDRWEGFLTGGFMALVFGPFIWAIFVLPFNLLAWGIYRLPHWRRFRTAWLLAPSLAIVGVFVIGKFILHPPTAEGRFFHTTGVIFPRAEVSALVCSFTPDTWADGSEDLYEFTCSPETTDRIVQDLRLEGGLDASANEYRYGKEIRPDWFCDLTTDSTRTKVHIRITGF